MKRSLGYYLAPFKTCAFVFITIGIFAFTCRAEWPKDEIHFRDKEVLKAADLDYQASTLIKQLEHFFPSKVPLGNFAELVKKLGDEDFRAREVAMEALLKAGPGIVPLLQREEKNRDPEISSRVKFLIEKLDTRTGKSCITAAAIRLLGQTNPLQGIALVKRVLKEKEENPVVRDALLDYFSKALKSDSACREEFDKMLSSNDRVAQVFAIQALGLSGEKLESLYPLLSGSDRGLRNHAGWALLKNGKKEALGPLIRNLGEGTKLQNFILAEMLARIVGSSEAKKQLAVSAPNWNLIKGALEKKLTDFGPAVDLIKGKESEIHLTGYLAAVANISTPSGAVFLFFPDGSHQKLFDVPILPMSVDAIGHSLILVQESSRVVYVKNYLGENLASHDEKSILMNTRIGKEGKRFYFSRTALLESSFSGENSTQVATTNSSFVGGTLWKNKEPVVVNREGKVETFDSDGKKQGSFTIPMKNTSTLYLEGSEGHLLAAPLTGNIVNEFDGKGQLIRSWPVQANTMRLLSNGNLLAGSRTKNTLAEYDFQGRMIRDWKVEARVYKICQLDLRLLPRD